jgi:L-fuconolactonase
MNTPATHSKLHDGRDDEILDTELPIIDTHHHLMQNSYFHYMLPDFLRDVLAGHNVVATVYVETQAMVRRDGPALMRPIGEIEFANGVGAIADSGTVGSCRVCAAIVGYAELTAGDQIALYLDRALSAAPDRLRGVRQMAYFTPNEAVPVSFTEGLLMSSVFREGYRHLSSRNLHFEAGVFHNQLPEVCDLADTFEHTQIALNHAGMAVRLGLDELGKAQIVSEWRKLLAETAKRPNIFCKIGGLGYPTWGFGFEYRPGPVTYRELASAWAPYVETAIELFGVDRCSFECDFPMDSVSSGYVPAWNALKHVTKGYSSDERLALFHNSAARFFRIPTVATQIDVVDAEHLDE